MTNPSPLAREFVETGRTVSCPVIDMHGHYGPFQGIYMPSPDAAGMLRTMDRCGVTRVICSSHASLVDVDRGNALMAEVVAANPARFYGYWTVNPNYPRKIERDLGLFHSVSGFVGFKFHPDFHKYPITGDNYKPVLEYASANRCIILSHTWGQSPYCSPPMVRQVAGPHPGATLLMGHAGYGEWAESARIARDLRNVYLEITAAYAVGGVIEFYVGNAGADRIVFGTDLPWFDEHYGIGCVVFARITDEDRHSILHRNAEDILARAGLPGSSQAVSTLRESGR